MSRIHEALRKVEQDRIASPGTGPENGHAEQVWVPELVPPAATETSGFSGPPVAAMPAAASSFPALLASCPRSDWTPDVTMLFFGTDDQKPGTEQFRTLRARLLQLREKQPLKKILVTSALREEGRSFVSANLAQALARQQGWRSLLIDGDLRYPGLHSLLGVSAEPGLSDYLRGEAEEGEILRRGQMENLFLLPAGREAVDPAGLAASSRWKLLLQRMEALFDWIIVDTPAAIPVSDASVLAAACDGVLIVVRSQATPADAASKMRQQFSDMRLLGVVLNGTQAQPSTQWDYQRGILSTSRYEGF
jgi:capsular exopolysaccharide synthesis family protein